MNYTIPNIPVLATQLNDTDLFEKSDGPASGQSQRVTGAVMKAYFGSAIQSQTVTLDNTTSLYRVAHGLGVAPKYFRSVFQCVTNDTATGYVVGQEISTTGLYRAGSPLGFMMPYADATNVYLGISYVALVGNEGQFIITVAAGNTTVSPTSWNNFKLKFYYA